MSLITSGIHDNHKRGRVGARQIVKGNNASSEIGKRHRLYLRL